MTYRDTSREPSARTSRPCRRLRRVKAALALAVAAWGLLGAAGNVIDWRAASASVASVTSMSTFSGGVTSWRATTSPAVVVAGVCFIVLFKSASAAFCLAGAWRMWSARSRDGGAFAEAAALAVVGCAFAVLGLFVGWVVIAEGWFQMWRSDALRESAAETAFRYGGFIALIGLLIATRED